MTWLRLKEGDRDVLISTAQISFIKREGNKARITLATGERVETSIDYNELIIALRYEGEVTEIDGQ